jgi:GGDEF domain-containing protein
MRTSRLDRNAPEEVRRQLSVQLRIERAQLAGIPADGRIRLSGNRELTAAFVDVDGLKALNDTRGHARGDLMLMALADVLKATLRDEDIVFRYRGDEFVCAMPFTSIRVAGDLLLDTWHALDGLGWHRPDHRPGDRNHLVMRRAVGLPALAIVLALATGAALGGVGGAIAAVPLAFAAQVVILRAVAPAIRRRHEAAS